MKGYLFVRGIGNNYNVFSTTPEEKIYTNFEKAFNHLVELNHFILEKYSYAYEFYEDGYSYDYYPDTDEELKQAEEECNWKLVNKLIDKHRIKDEKEINRKLIFKDDNDINYLPNGVYALIETEIIN
jgi:hypothetical protein